MPPAERQELKARLAEPAANASIHAATSLYLQQDIRYRAATAPVIRELMTTLATLKK